MTDDQEVTEPLELTLEQRIEMTDAWREAHRKGRPQDAQKYRQALDDGVYFEIGDDSEAPEAVELPLPPPRSGKGSGKEEWLEWALEVSDVDPEVLGAIKKVDIIKMMEANALIPMLGPEETLDDEGEETLDDE